MGRGQNNLPPAPSILDFKPEKLFELLNKNGVEYIVVGGMAVSAHGYIRTTNDLDICPKQNPENIRRLAKTLETIKYTILGLGDFNPNEFDLKPDFEGLSQGGNWRLQTQYGILDIMQYFKAAEDVNVLFDEAIELDIDDVKVQFVGYDDLLLLKTDAGRPQDKADIEALKAYNEGKES